MINPSSGITVTKTNFHLRIYAMQLSGPNSSKAVKVKIGQEFHLAKLWNAEAHINTAIRREESAPQTMTGMIDAAEW